MSFSQIFSFNETSHIPQDGLKLQSYQLHDMCLVAEATKLDVVTCKEGDAAQTFTIQGNHTAVWKPEQGPGKPQIPQRMNGTGLDNSTASTPVNKTEWTDGWNADSPMPIWAGPPPESGAGRSSSVHNCRYALTMTTPLRWLLVAGEFGFGLRLDRWVFLYLTGLLLCVSVKCSPLLLMPWEGKNKVHVMQADCGH